MEEFDSIITLNDEDGSEVQFEFLDLIEYEGEEFIVLLPIEDESGDVVIFKIEEADNPDEENYVGISDNELLQKVFEIFKERYKDEFDSND